MPRRPASWEPNQPLTTQRLAWIVAYPELQRRSSPWWAVPLRIITGLGGNTQPYRGGPAFRPLGTQFANELGQDVKSDRMASYAFPVDTVARRLSQDEAAALRESGTLPDWFFDAVEEERKADRRLHR